MFSNDAAHLLSHILDILCVGESERRRENSDEKFRSRIFFTLNVPVSNFSVNDGTEPTLPGFNKYSRELMCLAQGRNAVTPAGINPGPLDSESDALSI